MCKKVQDQFFPKGMFASIVWTPELANIPPCCVFRYKLSMQIEYLAIRWQSWQTWFKAKQLTNILPSNRGAIYYFKLPRAVPDIAFGCFAESFSNSSFRKEFNNLTFSEHIQKYDFTPRVRN